MCRASRFCGLFLAVSTWLALAAFGQAAAGELPPVDFTVFYSPAYAGWQETNAAIEGVMKKSPCLRRTLVPTDIEAGKTGLGVALKLLNLKPDGDVFLIMGPFALINRGEQREIEAYFGPMVARILDPAPAKGRLDAPIERFAERTFGAGTVAAPLPGKPEGEMDFFEVQREGRICGYLVHAYRSIRCPLCSDAQVVLAIECKKMTVVALYPVRPLERYGRSLESTETSAFLKRYVGRPLSAPLDSTDVVVGATRTRKAYDQVIAQVLPALKARLGRAPEQAPNGGDPKND